MTEIENQSLYSLFCILMDRWIRSGNLYTLNHDLDNARRADENYTKHIQEMYKSQNQQ